MIITIKKIKLGHRIEIDLDWEKLEKSLKATCDRDLEVITACCELLWYSRPQIVRVSQTVCMRNSFPEDATAILKACGNGSSDINSKLI